MAAGLWKSGFTAWMDSQESSFTFKAPADRERTSTALRCHVTRLRSHSVCHFYTCCYWRPTTSPQPAGVLAGPVHEVSKTRALRLIFTPTYMEPLPSKWASSDGDAGEQVCSIVCVTFILNRPVCRDKVSSSGVLYACIQRPFVQEEIQRAEMSD